MVNIIIGFLIGSMILEPIVINFIYFTNVGLFNDIILTPKNRKKLEEFYLKRSEKNSAI